MWYLNEIAIWFSFGGREPCVWPNFQGLIT